MIKKAKDNPNLMVGKKELTVLEASPKNRKKSKLSRKTFKRIECELKIKAVIDNGLSVKKTCTNKTRQRCITEKSFRSALS